MRSFLVVSLLLIVSMGAHAAKESYTIDAHHTYPNFTINHLGFSTMHGRFDKTSGQLTFDRSTMTGSIDIVIDATSVSTGMKKRDDHLRGPDFLNSGEYPLITFQASDVKLNENGAGPVQGTLTLAGVSKPVTLMVKNMHCGLHPFDPKKKKFVCGFNATATIMRSDFGVKYGLPAIGDEMQLSFEVEAIRD